MSHPLNQRSRENSGGEWNTKRRTQVQQTNVFIFQLGAWLAWGHAQWALQQVSSSADAVATKDGWKLSD